jgi:hypothetical protein
LWISCGEKAETGHADACPSRQPKPWLWPEGKKGRSAALKKGIQKPDHRLCMKRLAESGRAYDLIEILRRRPAAVKNPTTRAVVDFPAAGRHINGQGTSPRG